MPDGASVGRSGGEVRSSQRSTCALVTHCRDDTSFVRSRSVGEAGEINGVRRRWRYGSPIQIGSARWRRDAGSSAGRRLLLWPDLAKNDDERRSSMAMAVLRNRVRERPQMREREQEKGEGRRGAGCHGRDPGGGAVGAPAAAELR
ncbi:hypothetical protein D1007_57404 [Hordeum vulgare]|nr:hypothetical protein D1007_57404 [Hordeum vulgare]